MPLDLKAILGGLSLRIIHFIFPLRFGEWYKSINQLANNSVGAIGDNITVSTYWENWRQIMCYIAVIRRDYYSIIFYRN